MHIPLRENEGQHYKKAVGQVPEAVQMPEYQKELTRRSSLN